MSVDTPAPVPSSRSPLTAVTGAIQKAAQKTGASFDYLLTAAKVESNLDPNLSMRSSSATGLFQFIEQTWLEMMKQAGKTLGFGRYADAITETSSGHYEVNDPTVRAEIMQLRKDPAANAAMGGVFTQQNAAILSQRLGRKPTDGELYIAHFFGPYSAAKVISAAGNNPTANAVEMFPAAAQANRPIFYDRQGNARSIAGVYQELVRRYQVARASPMLRLTRAAAADPPAAPSRTSEPKPQALPESNRSFPVALASPAAVMPAATATSVDPVPDTAGVTRAFAVANASPSTPSSSPASSPVRLRDGSGETGSMFLSLFQTEERRGGVGSLVAELWGANHAHLRATEADGTKAAAFATEDNMNAGDDATDNGGSLSPLDLFQDMPPRARSLFRGDD